MRFIFCYLLYFIFSINNAVSQKDAVDSFQYYANNNGDSILISRLIDYCFNHKQDQSELSKEFSEKALEQSEKIGFKAGQARSLINLGAIEVVKANYPAALQYYLDALKFWEDLDSQRGIMMAKNNIGQVYGFLKNKTLQYKNLQEALSIASKNNFLDGLALANTNLSLYYAAINDFRTAFNYQYQAIQAFIGQHKMNEAATGYTNLGGYQFYLSHLDSALIYYEESKRIGDSLGNKFILCLSLANIAEVYENQHKIPAAIEFYNRSLEYAKSENLKEQLLFCYGQLAGIYEREADYANANTYLKAYQKIKDSVYNANSSQQLNELQIKYETAKNEKALQQQKFANTKKQYWIIGLVLIILASVIIAASIYKRNQLKQQQKLQEVVMKQQDLATQAIIAAEENERQRIATDLHDGVGQLMSAAKMNLSGFEEKLALMNEADKLSYQKIIALVDESCREVRQVSHNMMPNALLKAGLGNAVKDFIDKIDSKILKVNLYVEGLQERLNENVETILYRVIQECVNNVIKHSGANHLEISIIKDQDGIAMSIEDNGKGLDLNELVKSQGIGMKNIRARVGYLKGTVDFDTSPGKGMLVAIHIPNS